MLKLIVNTRSIVIGRWGWDDGLKLFSSHRRLYLRQGRPSLQQICRICVA
jgi:hypothetical protein